MKILLLLSIFCLHLAATTLGAIPEPQLPVHRARTLLPVIRDGFVAHYDGDDSIYLFGDGYEGGNDILKYSISADSLSILGRSPYVTRAVATFKGPQPELIYIAAHASSELGRGGYIYTFNMESNQMNVLLGPGIFFMENRAVAQVDNDFAYFFGGFANGLEFVKMDLNTMNYTRDLDHLPIHFWTPTAWGARDDSGDILVLGNATELVGDTVMHYMRYNEASGNYSLRSVPLDVAFAGDIQSHFSVMDKAGHIWHIGSEAFRFGKETILQFDPVSEKFTSWNVQWLEGRTDCGLQAAALSYVEKLNRIYIFGGRFGNTAFPFPRERDEIWYIDLDEANK